MDAIILLLTAFVVIGIAKKAYDELVKAIAKPCDEAARTIRDVRQCGHAVAGETRKFLEVQENCDDLKRAAAAILILGIAGGIVGALGGPSNSPSERQTYKPVQMRTRSLRERRERRKRR